MSWPAALVVCCIVLSISALAAWIAYLVHKSQPPLDPEEYEDAESP